MTIVHTKFLQEFAVVDFLNSSMTSNCTTFDKFFLDLPLSDVMIANKLNKL